MDEKDEIEKLQKLINCAKRPVFFGGAGVSTASGIPDFRSSDGLYNQEYKFPPEQIVSRTFFEQNPEEFYRFYFDKIIDPLIGENAAKPNATHVYLAQNKIPVVTQNIDGLHTGTVFELHGTAHRNYCLKCRATYDLEQIVELSVSCNAKNRIPFCNKLVNHKVCGGIVKPDVVLYEEGLPSAVWDGAQNAIAEADLLIVGGTSLTVYPASSLVRLFKGDSLVLINRDETFADTDADVVIRTPIQDVFANLTPRP